MNSSPAIDVAIVGAGVIGASIAYHLCRRGASVLIADPGSPAPPSASWASAGGIRRQRRDPREWALSRAAAARWPKLADELGTDCRFRPGGHLHVATTEAALDRLRSEADRERAGGIEQELVDGTRARQLAPGLAAEVLGGVFTRDDGQADPRLTTQGFLGAAMREGAIHRRAAVEELVRDSEGRLTGVRVGEDTVRAPTVVLAAGSWSGGLAATLGLDLPLQVLALQMLRTVARPAELAPTLGWEEHPLSLKQRPDGAFFIGGGWPGDVDLDTHTATVREASVSGSWAVATELYPALDDLLVVERFCGLEASSFDGCPLIGPHPAAPCLYLATGFSGHGFQLAPAVGEAVAEALTGPAPPSLAQLAADRRPD